MEKYGLQFVSECNYAQESHKCQFSSFLPLLDHSLLYFYSTCAVVDVTTSLYEEEKGEVALPWQQSFWITTIGSLSNDAADGKENWKNAIGLYTQNKNSARAPRFFVRFLAVVT